MCVTYRNFYPLHSFRRGDGLAKRLARNASIIMKVTLIFLGAVLLDTVQMPTATHSEPMSRSFPLFKRCEWLVGN